jgi:hypothetical protein
MPSEQDDSAPTSPGQPTAEDHTTEQQPAEHHAVYRSPIQTGEHEHRLYTPRPTRAGGAGDGGVDAHLSVQLTVFSSTEWLVTDSTIAAGSPGALLGFIQHVGGHYEVTRLGGPRVEFSVFASFEEAVGSLSVPTAPVDPGRATSDNQ